MTICCEHQSITRVICIRGFLIISLCTAFLLRVWGLSFGLPYHFHPDEHQYINPALAWHQTGVLQTGTVNPPLFIYILILAYQVWLWLSPFQDSEAWITATIFFARLWSVAFGLLTVALTFPVGRRLYNPKTGLLASILLAALFLPARDSHFAVNDTVTTFFVLLALYFSLGILKYRNGLNYLLTGIAIGLATATKLTGGVAVFPMLLAHWLAYSEQPVSIQRFYRGRGGRQLLGAIALAISTFTLLALPVLWDFSHLLDSITKHLQFGSKGYKGIQMAPFNGWFYYLSVLGWGVGWLLLAFIFVGLSSILIYRYYPGYLVASLPVLLFLVMGTQKILFARFILPAIPPLILLASLALVWIEAHNDFFKTRGWLFGGGLLLLLIQPLATLFYFNHLITLPDTRQTASVWLLENFPPETVLVKESYAVFPNEFVRTRVWPFKTIQIDERGPTRNQIDHYLSHKTNLIAISNFTFNRVRQNPAAEAVRLEQLLYLEDKAELIKQFSPYRSAPDWFYLDELYGPAGETWLRTQPGPLIKIYRLPYEGQPYNTALPNVSQPLKANFDDQLLLLGYNLPQRRANPGENLPLTLYWQALTRPAATYVIFNRLLDADQKSWGGYDRWPQETSNTTLWHVGEIVVDTFALPISANAPNGIYTIDLGLYNQADPIAASLPLVGEGYTINELASSIRLGPIKVGGPPPNAVITEASPQHPLDVNLGDIIALRGYDLQQAEETLRLQLYWQSIQPTVTDYTIFAHLRTESGELLAQKDQPPTAGRYPTSLWDAGEIIPDDVIIPLPDDVTSPYQLMVGLYDPRSGVRLLVPNSVNDAVLLDNKLEIE